MRRTIWRVPLPHVLISAILMAFMISIISSCNSSSSSTTPAGPSAKAKWTYMVYVGGDNNLSDAAFADINDMESVGSTADVNIVVQAEFSPEYTPNLPSHTMRGRITKDASMDGISSTLENIGTVNMASKEALTGFIDWATTQYPADNYALVLWDHGSGWKVENRRAFKGAIEDATAGSYMSVPDIAAAIRDAAAKPDVINFDACLMAMYEVAYEFNGLTDYMVFSEELEPGSGDPYSMILAALTTTPSMDTETLSKTISQQYRVFYEQGENRSSVTKSVVDMAYIPALHTAMTNLSDEMVASIDADRTFFQTARDASIYYGDQTFHDLGDYLKELSKHSLSQGLPSYIDAVSQALSNCVISNELVGMSAGDKILRSTGLSVFLPSKSEVTSADLTSYGTLAINSTKGENVGWVKFVNTLVSGDTGSPLETRPGNFAFWLTWDTDADLDLIIWEPDGTFAAPFIGASSENAFLSQDSSVSGKSEEIYSAHDRVQAGDYDVLINYYEDGTQSGPTTATLHYVDPENGYTSFTIIATRGMSLSVKAPEGWMDDDAEWQNVYNDMYTDWWYPTYVTRSMNSGLNLVAGGDTPSKVDRDGFVGLPQKSLLKPRPLPEEAEALKDSLNVIRSLNP